MIRRPDGMGAFEFAVLSGLRAAQLQEGCLPRVQGTHAPATMAQLEIAERKVVRLDTATAAVLPAVG